MIRAGHAALVESGSDARRFIVITLQPSRRCCPRLSSDYAARHCMMLLWSRSSRIHAPSLWSWTRDVRLEVSVVGEFGSYSVVSGGAFRREVWLVVGGSTKSRIFPVAHVFHCTYCFTKARWRLRQMSFRLRDCRDQWPNKSPEPTAVGAVVRLRSSRCSGVGVPVRSESTGL